MICWTKAGELILIVLLPREGLLLLLLLFLVVVLLMFFLGPREEALLSSHNWGDEGITKLTILGLLLGEEMCVRGVMMNNIIIMI